MNVSLNWLKQYVNLDQSPEELAELIGARLVEIEGIVDIGLKYKDAVIARVISQEPIADTDHLSLVKIDDGGLKQIDRDENGYIQVVCGAPNVRADMTVVWLPPESTVPSSVNDKEPFVLSVREIKSIKSYGMLASSKELDLSDDHNGILSLSEDNKPGSLLKDVLELDDLVLDIENKSLTHRPDAFGVLGFARELAGITNQQFKSPDWFVNPVRIDNESSSSLMSVGIDNSELSSKYCAVMLTNADITKATPLKIQSILQRVGVRPINSIVDVTNYVMLLTGQPLHAFDYDKVVALAGKNPLITVRNAREGEELELLDSKKIKLNPEDIVISAGDHVISLAGAMGAKNTAVDENTKTVILESASFNLYSLRSTQMRHGIFSEAITRFTKGQPAGLCYPALSYAVELMHQYTGSEVASAVAVADGSQSDNPTIEFSAEDVNRLLGTELSQSEIAQTLTNVEWSVNNTGDKIEVRAPFWRTDVKIKEDVIEEIGRLRGFDSIDPKLPLRPYAACMTSDFDKFRQIIRNSLSKMGANEIVTYSFVHGDMFDKSNLDKNNAYKITNAISPDLQYYRQSLVPSLLNLVHPNIKSGFDEFVLFEMNKVHIKSSDMTDENVPIEDYDLAVVFADKNSKGDDAFYHVGALLTYLTEILGINLKIASVGSEALVSGPFENVRSGIIMLNDEIVGVIGEFNKKAIDGFKLPTKTAGLEIDLQKLFSGWTMKPVYKPVSKYPQTDRDICFKVPATMNYSDLFESLSNASETNNVDVNIQPLSIYSQDGSRSKNITFRLTFVSYEKTLTSEDTHQIMNKIITEVASQTHAEVV